MKRILLAITMILALGVSGVSAQVLEDADGLESAHGRQYSAVSSTTSAATASNTASTPEPMEAEAEYKSIAIIGLSFESDEAAENFFGEMRTVIEAEAEQGTEENDAEIKDIDIADGGFLAVMNVPNTGANTVLLFVDGNTMFLVDVTHPDRETANTIATDIAEFVADAEIENEEVTFNEDGTSTGGVFDRMPTGEDEVIGDLTTIIDAEVYTADAE